MWRNKELPAWKNSANVERIDYKPKAILDRPSIYITEDGENINIELPHVSIAIKKKNHGDAQ